MNSTLVSRQGARLRERTFAHVALVGAYVFVPHVVHYEARAARE